jgi:2-carboxy-1,4-naphthoquinone phytyltransferase
MPDGSPPPKGPTAASKRALWLAAIKPPMYSVGLVPVAVAAAAVPLLHPAATAATATAASASFAPLALQLAAAAAAIIAWLNLSNDAFDAATGVDAAGMGKPESVVALTGGRAWPVLLLSLGLLAAGGAGLAQGVGRAAAAPGAAAAASAMLAAAVACGYVYQGPPFRMSYKGLGEPLCFVAFGPLATAAFYLTLAPRGALDAAAAAAAATVGSPALAAVAAVPPSIWALSFLVGASTTVILFCSHFHQTQGDKAVGKMSPLVRLGTARGVAVLRAAVALTYASAAVACGPLGLLPPLPVIVAAAVSLGAARQTVAFAEANHEEARLVAPLKRFATRWHIAWGGGLAAGLALAAWAAAQGLARRGGVVGALLLGGA